MRWVRNRLRQDSADRGAVAVIVTVLVAGGVLLGMGALAIDTGQMYAERAQVQNGADAGALAVAQTCAAGSCTASSAAREADGNANDNTTNVDLVCGSAPGLGACPAPKNGALTCAQTPPGSYAEVHTSTRTPDGSTLLPPVFGRTVLGSSYNGVTIHGCAQAAWGAPKRATGLALTISWCEWNSYTGGGSNYQAPPPAVPPASAEQVIYFHNTSPNPTHCTAGPSGFDVPGDFGSTASDGNCQTLFNFDTTTGTTTYGAETGSSLSGDCQTALRAAQQNHTIVFIPIYIGVSGTGSNGTYTLWQMAAFVVTGYYWPSWGADSWLTGRQPCRGNARCISGYFTTGVDPGGVYGGGPGAGANVVQLTG